MLQLAIQTFDHSQRGKIQKFRAAFNLDYLTQGLKAVGSIVPEILVIMLINGDNLLYMLLLFHIIGFITDFELAFRALHGTRRQKYEWSD